MSDRLQFTCTKDTEKEELLTDLNLEYFSLILKS